jgi:hypothetical protein
LPQRGGGDRVLARDNAGMANQLEILDMIAGTEPARVVN